MARADDGSRLALDEGAVRISITTEDGIDDRTLAPVVERMGGGGRGKDRSTPGSR
jgi:hypothetical protein